MADIAPILQKARNALESAENAEFSNCRQSHAMVGIGWLGYALIMILEDIEHKDD